MAFLLTLALTALTNGVLASATTSGREQLGTTQSTPIPYVDVRMHKNQFLNSTRLNDLHTSWTTHPSMTEGTATTRQLLPHLPWLGNASSTVAQTATGTSKARPTTTVVVGKGGELVFSPSSLNATAGSTIAFNFLELNHTLSQSEFENPCHSNGGFDTGFAQFNPANISGRFIVEYVVRDNMPRWFFCAQTINRSHCQAGMVFSLNSHGRHSQFVDNALATASVSPSLTKSACPFLTPATGSPNTGLTFYPTGTVSAGLGANSSVISPPISNPGSANRVSYVGIVLALAFL
jgi:plastocyanin